MFKKVIRVTFVATALISVAAITSASAAEPLNKAWAGPIVRYVYAPASFSGTVVGVRHMDKTKMFSVTASVTGLAAGTYQVDFMNARNSPQNSRNFLDVCEFTVTNSSAITGCTANIDGMKQVTVSQAAADIRVKGFDSRGEMGYAQLRSVQLLG